MQATKQAKGPNTALRAHGPLLPVGWGLGGEIEIPPLALNDSKTRFEAIRTVGNKAEKANFPYAVLSPFTP